MHCSRKHSCRRQKFLPIFLAAVLPIGDMAWIAQCSIKGSTTTAIIEVMCGTILERKEISDFSSSLFGTRYNEQRLRLQNSGLPQVLFLVEGELNRSANCPPETLHMAMMETRVHLGFSIVQTKHLEDTVRLLKGLHRRIVQRTFPEAFSSNENDDPLPSFTSPSEGAVRNGKRADRRQRRPTSLLELVFDSNPVPPFGASRFVTYRELKAKVERDREAGQRTVGAVYMAMLKQVPSFSHKKCHAIARQYPTFNALLSAYACCAAPDPALMVRDVSCERQKIGPKSSQELYIACCTGRDGNLPKIGTTTTTASAKTTVKRRVMGKVDGDSNKSSSSSSTSRRDVAPKSPDVAATAVSCVDLTSPVAAPSVTSVGPTTDSSLSSSCIVNSGNKISRKRDREFLGRSTSYHAGSKQRRTKFAPSAIQYGRNVPPFDSPSSNSTGDSFLNAYPCGENDDKMPAKPLTKNPVGDFNRSCNGSGRHLGELDSPNPSVVILDSSDDDSCSNDQQGKPSSLVPKAIQGSHAPHSNKLAKKPQARVVSNTSASSAKDYKQSSTVNSGERTVEGERNGTAKDRDGDTDHRSRIDSKLVRGKLATLNRQTMLVKVSSPPEDVEVIEID